MPRRLAVLIRAHPAETAALVVAAALLVPLWSLHVFPSQDGPSHVANARVLLSLLSGEASEWSAVYRLNLEPFPNWFTHASLAGLLSVLAPAHAEKLFLSLYLLGLLASFRFAVSALRKEAAALFGVVLPLAFDQAIHLGYYNRSFASVPLLLAIGLWVRRRGRPGILGSLGLGSLLLWLYFCAAAGLLVGLLSLASLLATLTLEERRSSAPDAAPALRHRLAVLGGASLAPLSLLAWFQLRHAGGVAGPGPGALERLRALATLDWLAALDVREVWLSAALAAVLAGLLLAALLARGFTPGWREGLLVAAALATALYLVAPSVHLAGHGPWGGPSHDRIAPYIPLLGLLWLAARPVGRAARRALLSATLAASVGLLGVRLPRYVELDAQLREYLSVAAWLPRGATLLPLGFFHHGRSAEGRPLSEWTWPFRHAADWFVASRGVVDVDNYEAQVPFFPVVLRTGYDPYRLLGSSLDRMPACVWVERFNRRAPRPAEFVLLWGAREISRGEPCTERLFESLQTGYRRVYTSVPEGRAELYRYVGATPETR